MYYPKYEGESLSLTVALKSVGEYDTSLINKRKIAVANGMPLYIGTRSQNNKLLEYLKKGTLVKP